MEYKLIVAVSGFPSLYDTNSVTYRDLNMRSEAWRQIAEMVGVPESECRRKWKTLRDQHRRERQREKDRRESGIGLSNYKPWRYSAILSFLNPFIDARAAGTNGWALDPQPSHIHELVGCSTTTEIRSDDDETYGFAVADATTTSSPSSIDFSHRKRSSADAYDCVGAKEAKLEPTGGADGDLVAQQANMKQLFERMMQSVTSLASTMASSHSDQPPPPELELPERSLPPPWATSRMHPLKTEEQDAEVDEILIETDEDEEEEERRPASPRPTRAKRKSADGVLEELLRRMEAREAQRERDAEPRDDVTLFLLSLAPAMRRLTAEKQSWIRTRMQQLLHEAEFGAMKLQ
ncbi:uncharacterized protein PAE49_001836 [Odontesthes bonariensis]|uniref:uncharacterized protein LOC142375050 n=1 Tax=Odontesthes bonariensis TaxID=219752 RepID=UPI003F58ACBE